MTIATVEGNQTLFAYLLRTVRDIFKKMPRLVCNWPIYILIQGGCPFSAFPAHLHLQIHMPTSSLSSYLAASAKSAVTLFRQIVTLRGITLPISYKVHWPFGEHMGRLKVAHGSHNDVRHLCWYAGAIFVPLAELGLRKPPSETPEGLGLLEEEA